jgi:hypothetical protein
MKKGRKAYFKLAKHSLPGAEKKFTQLLDEGV